MLFNKKNDNSRSGKRRSTLLMEDRGNLLSSKSDFFIREAYKTLRTNVTFSLTGDSNSKLVLVTSSLQSEGKSITAANLAISYAQTDRRVLLIDCDLRRPKLSRLFNISAPAGLSNVLMSPDLLSSAVVSTETKGLDVLPSGDIPPNPSELLSSARMQRLLDYLRTQYDYIILDTPPINMVIDAVVLAPHCDGVLFVIRSGRSERGAVIHAVEQLQYAKSKILGFVLNDMQLESTNYGYGKYRYKRYTRYGRYRRYGYYGGYYGGYSGYGYGYGYGYGSRREEPESTTPGE